jgi:hypothetical protein
MADQFTCKYQLAGYAYDQYDQKGPIDYDRFVTAFDQFPWIEQAGKRAAMNDGCSATISVTNQSKGIDYWVSIAGTESEHFFLLGIVYEKEVKTLFGFGKTKRIRWVEIYVAPSRGDILSTFGLFFMGHTDQLFETTRKFKLFGEMEARNPEKA